MNSQSWVEALNINPDSLSEWSAQAPAGMPLLVWCLEQGHVSIENYFSWAQEFFGLPVLDSQFFSQLDSALLEESRHAGTWHPWRFPVDKWDNVTIVACVEPPTDQDHPEVSYVLADPRAMISAWGPVTTTGVRPISDEKTPTDMPAGFSDSAKPFVLNLEGDLFGNTKTHHTSTKIALEPEPVLAEPPPSTPPPAFEDDEMLVARESIEPPELTTVSIKQPKLKVVSNEDAPKAPPAPVKSEPLPGNEQEAVQAAFKEIVTKYPHALLMKSIGTKAVLNNFHGSLKVANPDNIAVDLSYPTFLRIVNKTGLPYHGYLIDSPAHREYFEGLGLQGLPGCVTAIPIKHKGNVVGMLVAFGGSDLLKTEFMNFVSQIAARLSQVISSSWAKAS